MLTGREGESGVQNFSRHLRQAAVAVLVRVVPRNLRIKTEDRRVLERVIFTAMIASGLYRRILFVGCRSYTRWYPMLFHRFSGVVFSTVDSDPAQARFGSRRDHTVGFLHDVGRDPDKKDFYDCVILNGVFGFGIDTDRQKREAFDAAWRLLKPGGIILVGYNDVSKLMEGDIVRDQCQFDLGMADPRRFRPAPIPGFSGPDVVTQTPGRHRFVCFAKL